MTSYKVSNHAHLIMQVCSSWSVNFWKQDTEAHPQTIHDSTKKAQWRHSTTPPQWLGGVAILSKDSPLRLTIPACINKCNAHQMEALMFLSNELTISHLQDVCMYGFLWPRPYHFNTSITGPELPPPPQGNSLRVKYTKDIPSPRS